MVGLIRKYWKLLVRSFSSSKAGPNIPIEIHGQEKLIRGIYSPINIKVNKITQQKTLQVNAFKSPPEKDEVSVLRLDYTDCHFCKNFIKSGENQEKQREYVGLAVINYHEVLTSSAHAVYSPLNTAITHADIKTGYVLARGVAAPAELNLILKNLVKFARFKEDPQPQQKDWKGENLE
jgi:hypothetical protein